IDPLAMKATLLANAPPSITPAMLVDRGLALAEKTLADNNYRAAAGLLQALDGVAQKTKNQQLVTQIRSRGRDVTDLAKEYDSASKAFEIIDKKGNDPEANSKWGKFLCFYKGAWDEGLPFLAKGNEVELRIWAGKELTKPTGSTAQMELGDEWWKIAESKEGLAKKQLLLHAKYWYEQAATKLEGFER